MRFMLAVLGFIAGLVLMFWGVLEPCWVFWRHIVNVGDFWSVVLTIFTSECFPVFGIIASAKGFLSWWWIAQFIGGIFIIGGSAAMAGE